MLYLHHFYVVMGGVLHIVLDDSTNISGFMSNLPIYLYNVYLHTFNIGKHLFIQHKTPKIVVVGWKSEGES